MSHTVEAFSSRLYFDRTFGCEAAKIGPGEYYFTDKDMLIVTVLGSCVSACIRDIKSGVGGMNHFMLPNNSQADKDSPVSESMRYGSYAMEVLLNQLFKNGGRRENLEAKIFGGGRVLQDFKVMNVGERNADFVRQFLLDEGIRVTGEDLNDVYPRKVYFFPKTGKVMVKKMKSVSNPQLLKREAQYASQFRAGAMSGDVDLF
jgi:chemotaxis protein CheD